MSRKYLAALALALTGCAGQTQPEDITIAEQQCANHGGYEGVSRYERGRYLLINCKDGTYIEVRRAQQ